MKYLVQIFEALSRDNNGESIFLSSLLSVLLIAIIVYVGYSAYKKIMPNIQNFTNKANKRKKVAKDIVEINKKLDIMSEKICVLTNIVNEHIDDSILDTQASMKSILIQIYHKVKEDGYITECDAETFEDVIARYYKANGNGKIHKIVQPYIEEMCKNHIFQSEHEAEVYKKKHGHY